MIHRFVYRGWFSYLICYLLTYGTPAVVWVVPGFQWLARLPDAITHPLIPWLARHVLGVTRPITVFSSDTTFDWLLVACLAILATMLATAWSVLARGREPTARTRALLRVVVGYSLGVILVNYGVAKLTTMQFLGLTPERLLEPYGASSPQGLLWTFMGYSKPYTVFAGVIETMAGLLLFWRRTTLLGSLVAVAALTNVVIINFAYDVPVKLFSAHLLAMAAFLMVPDASRLLHAVLTDSDGGVVGSTSCRALPVVKALGVAILVALTFAGFLRLRRVAGDGVPEPPLFGIYDVASLSRNTQGTPVVLTDRTRWRRVVFNRFGGLAFYGADDSIQRYRVRIDAATGRITLSNGSGVPGSTTMTWAYNQVAANELVLDGDLGGDRIHINLRRVDDASFELLRDRFHWISDVPHNR